jgi:acetylornithine deacetylase/succinyl-diaminopimelate desuccinylase-like protein
MIAPEADALVTYVRANRERYVDELKTWIANPSTSANPAHHGDVRRSAEAVVARMRAAGLTEAEVLETDGLPVAYGSWLHAPGAPTILIYGHHDVQPADPFELWRSSFEAFLARHRERFACDAAVISDTAVFAEDLPSLTVSLRGLLHWEVTVRGPATDLHSGCFGGAVKNPLEALAQIIAALKNTDERIAVPGFYDGVREPGAREREHLAALPYDETKEAAALGVSELAGEAHRSPLERMWLRPTLEVNGMYGGYQGPGGKTIVPSLRRRSFRRAWCRVRIPTPPRAPWSAASARRRSSSEPAEPSARSRRSIASCTYRKCSSASACPTT